MDPTDVRARSGRSFDPGHAQVVPNHDGAGEIVAVGAGVPPSRVGEHVCCTCRTAVRFPLEQIDAAHEAVREHAVGKVLVEIP